MATIIYDQTRTPRSNPAAGIFTLVLGVGLMTCYLRGIGGAVAADIRNFPASYHSLPLLTLVFAVFKLVAYVSFGILFVLMIYLPARAILLPRIVSGTVKSISTPTEGSNVVSIQLGEEFVAVRDPGGLRATLEEAAIHHDEVRFTLGPFGYVVKVESLAGETPAIESR